MKQMELFYDPKDFNTYFRNEDGSLGNIFAQEVESANHAIQMVKQELKINRVLAVIPKAA